MKQFACLTFLTCVLLACSNFHKKSVSPLNTGNLRSSFITLNPGQAYDLKTPKGGRLRIPAGTFKTAGGPVRLEVKEAYSSTDILLAGLTTKSNGKLLKSGGMIYLGATAAGKKVDLSAPINASLPGPVYDPAMQVFKGELQENSSINWIDPQPLTDTTRTAKNIAWGEQLFKANCASCHKVMKDFTGPALAGFMNRTPGRKWLYAYIKSPYNMWQSGDRYAKALHNKWRPLMMTAFPMLSDNMIDALIVYTENEARLNGYTDTMPVNPVQNTTLVDSTKFLYPGCGSDTTYYQRYDTGFTELPVDAEAISLEEHLPDPVPTVYTFDIDVTGWYNIDQYADNNKALITDVQLSAVLKNAPPINMQVYLLVPDGKLLMDGFLEDEQYLFQTNNENLPLVLGKTAIIFAVGEEDGKFYYGISTFNIKKEQQVPILIKTANKETIRQALLDHKLDSIPLDIPENEYKIENKDCEAYDSSKVLVMKK